MLSAVLQLTSLLWESCERLLLNIRCTVQQIHSVRNYLSYGLRMYQLCCNLSCHHCVYVADIQNTDGMTSRQGTLREKPLNRKESHLWKSQARKVKLTRTDWNGLAHLSASVHLHLHRCFLSDVSPKLQLSAGAKAHSKQKSAIFFLSAMKALLDNIIQVSVYILPLPCTSLFFKKCNPGKRMGAGDLYTFKIGKKEKRKRVGRSGRRRPGPRAESISILSSWSSFTFLMFCQCKSKCWVGVIISRPSPQEHLKSEQVC